MTGKLHLQLAAAAIAMSLGLAAPAPAPARRSTPAGKISQSNSVSRGD